MALEGGDGLDAQEYARLKGEYEALRKVAIQKKIKLESLPPFPEEIVQEGKIRWQNGFSDFDSGLDASKRYMLSSCRCDEENVCVFLVFYVLQDFAYVKDSSC